VARTMQFRESDVSKMANELGHDRAESLPRVLVALRNTYARNLPEKVATLVASVRAALADEPVPGALAQATLAAHRIRGTAATYGFAALGEAAGRLEEELEVVAARAEGERRSERAAVEALLEQVLAGSELGEHPSLESGTSAPEPGSAAQPAPSASAKGPGTGARHAPLVQVVSARILVVDQDPETRTLVTQLGQQQILEVSAAATPAAALGLSRELFPDAALIAVPAQDPEAAFQLGRALRALPHNAHLPIAFMSSEPELEYRVAATHAGASLFLHKPVDADDFTTTVRQLLAARQDERPRVLILDDDHELAVRLAAVLGAAAMDVHVIEDPTGIIDALDETRPDALLLDLMLPGLSGIEVCRMLRILPRWQELPVLFISAQGNLESRMAAFAAGADDYLVKPLVDEELRSRIEVRVERARLRREREERDALTGLMMRRAFLQDLATRLGEAQRHGRPLTLCLLDLDEFKRVNDTRGHLAGDRVLTGLGDLLERRFRSEDLRGRWGGEEFVLAFPGERAESIKFVVQRLLDEFRSLSFFGDRGDVLRSSFSAGVATFPDDGPGIEELLQTADRRLYCAKERGRGLVVASDTTSQPAG
jgi:diguanylate cyclase (GGDEF)-like protein